MNIAIGGEGDAPAKRCGVTMKLTDDMVTAYATKTGFDFSTYKTGATFVDSDFVSQIVVGTPLEWKEYDGFAVPIAIGINKACRDYIVSLGEMFDRLVIIINSVETEYEDIDNLMLYEDGSNYVIIGMVEVDDTNSSTLSNGDWVSLKFNNETFNFDENTTVAPNTITFTPRK